MVDIQKEPLDPLQSIDLVRSALDPDERKFFKAYLGEESPTFKDWLSPQGRFHDARQLRNKITDMVVTEAFKQSKAPTVGDAQTLFPGHKELIPEQAYKAVPQSPLQAEDMPVMTGMQQQVVPDTRFQGPMPGVMTPLGQQNANLIDAWKPGSEPFPLNAQDRTGMAQQTNEFVQEGPRPMRTISTGIYGPDTAPSQSIELDKAMKLPPAFQAQLGAMQHQLSTRQPQAHAVTEADISLRNQTRLEQIMGGQPEIYPGERQFLESRLSVYNKEARPGSVPYKKDEAVLTQEQAKANSAYTRQDAEIADIKARTAENEAKENEIRILMDAKLRKLEAEANAANAAGSKESMKAYFQEQSALLDRAGRMMNMAIEGRKSGKMDDKSYTFLMNEALADMNVNATAGQAERNWFQEHFGTKGAVEVGPRSGNEPMRRMPGAPYQWTNPGGQQGEGVTQTPAPTETKGADETELKAFGRTLKEGETKPFKGSRWTRKGGKLIEVK